MTSKQHLWRFGSWCIGGLAWGMVAVTPQPAIGGQAMTTPAPFVLGDEVWEITAAPYVDTRDFLVGEAAIIVVQAPGNATLTGTIANVPGSMEGLIKLGAGALTLAGQTTATGVTRVLDGELVVASNGAIGHGGLQVNAGAALTYAPGVTVSGNTQFEAMALAEQPIPPGYAAVLPDSAAPIRWHVDRGQATHMGVLAGRAPFEKTGAGRLVLGHDALGYSGLAHVREGTLAVNELFSGAVQVMSGARLEGTGSVASVWVRDGGTLAPGASIGVLTIPGDLRFDTGATLSLEVAPDGRHDAVAVGGQATLAGDVHALAEAGDWQASTQYRFLTATGGLGGTRFDRVSSNFAFLTPTLSYDASSVTLTLGRNDVPLSEVAQTPEAAVVGDIIAADEPVTSAPSPAPEVAVVLPPEVPALIPETRETPMVMPEVVAPPVVAVPLPEADPVVSVVPSVSVPVPPAAPVPVAAVVPVPPVTPVPVASAVPAKKDLPRLYDAIVVLDRSEARKTLSQLTGVWPVTVRASLLEDSRFVRDAVLGQALYRAPGSSGVWANAYQAQGHTRQEAVAPGYARLLRGLTVGARHLVSHALTLGGFAGVQQRQVTQRDDTGDARSMVRSLHAGVDLAWQNDTVQWHTGVAAEWHDVSARRSVRMGRMSHALHTAWRSRTLQWFGQMVLAPAAVIQPFVQVALVHQHSADHVESGGPAALRYTGASDVAAYASLGLKAVKAFRTALGEAQVKGELAWRHRRGSGALASTAMFRDSHAATPFVTHGRNMPANALTARILVSTSLGRHGRLSMGYAGVLSPGWVDHGAMLQIRHRF